MRKVVIASDSFKGSLTSREVGEAASDAVLELFPECEVVCLDVADGGEGTMEALSRAFGGERIRLSVHGPLGDPVSAEYAVVASKGSSGPVAVLEMARASGLTLVSPADRNPLKTSTFGTGEMIADAIRQGCGTCIIGIGGSATNDAGIGMLAALGWRFLDAAGRALPPVGASLGAIAAIDDRDVDPRLRTLRFEVACDVDTPFCGPEGAAAVFAPQKGADADAVVRLEDGMVSFAAVIEQFTGVDVRSIPGAGAAGGLGGALYAFLGAALKPGADLVLDAVGFDAHVAGADLVITGEGRLDAQTAHGKLPHSVLHRASRFGVPTLALAGQVVSGADSILSGRVGPGEEPSFSTVLCVTPPGMPFEEAMRPEQACRNIYQALKHVLRS